MSIPVKKKVFVITLVLILSLFVSIKNANAAAPPPAGCTCPGPGGTCVGGGSFWVSATQYQGYHYCQFANISCPGAVRGWKETSRTDQGLDTHGCDDPTCRFRCAVTGILWEQIPPPTCTLTATPSSLEGAAKIATLNWTTTNTNLAVDSVIISNNRDATTITATATPGNATVTPTVNTTYTMTVDNGTIATCTTTVSVVSASCTILAGPAGVSSGNSTTIYWTVTAATGGTINDGRTSTVLTAAQIAAGAGNFVTPPITGTTIYNMTVTGVSNGLCNTSVVLTPLPTDGLVLCGRLTDNPATTNIDESKPCSICTAFYMLKNIINFILGLIIGIGVFILVIAGLIYAFSFGNQRKIELAKNAITNAVIGLTVVFIAWVVIAIILQAMGYASMTTWNQVDCNI